MSQEWDGKPLEDLISRDPTVLEEGMSVWTFLEQMSTGQLLRVTSVEAFSLALHEVFLEMYHNVLKRVGPSESTQEAWMRFKHLTQSVLPRFTGLYVEKGAHAQELDGALVRAQVLLHGLLHQRGLKRQARGNPAGQELRCRGGWGNIFGRTLICPEFAFHKHTFQSLSLFASSFFFYFSLFQTGRGNAACSVWKPTTKPTRWALLTRGRRWSGLKVCERVNQQRSN